MVTKIKIVISMSGRTWFCSFLPIYVTPVLCFHIHIKYSWIHGPISMVNKVLKCVNDDVVVIGYDWVLHSCRGERYDFFLPPSVESPAIPAATICGIASASRVTLNSTLRVTTSYRCITPWANIRSGSTKIVDVCPMLNRYEYVLTF